jgi:signal transduction histidine kinase
MNPIQMFHLYQHYQSYIGWSATDEDHIRAAAGVLEPHLQDLIDDFYSEIERHVETRQVIERSQTTIPRLKATLLRWLQELFAGPYDAQYVARRVQVGRRHVEVALEHVYVSTAMARLRAGLVATLSRYWPGEREGLVHAILSLNKLLDFDLMIIEVAYQTEYLTRLRQNEQLAKVGHVAGSVGHELRRPLNVLKTSAYYLRHSLNSDPEKRTEHLHRIDRNVEVAEQILKELSDLTGTPLPQLDAFSVEACVDEALERAPLSSNVRLTKNFHPMLPQALGDKEQICSVFIRLIRRAHNCMPEEGELFIHSQQVPNAVEVGFAGTGMSLPKETLLIIESPLSWRSVRVLGMSLAMVKAILDWNAGGLRAENKPGGGGSITVTLQQAASIRGKPSFSNYCDNLH